MNLKGRYQTGVRVLVLCCLSLFLICSPSVVAQGNAASPLIDLNLVPETIGRQIKQQVEVRDLLPAVPVPVGIQEKSAQFYAPGVARSRRTDNSRPVGKELGFGNSLSEFCLEMSRRGQTTVYATCDPIRRNSFDSDVSTLAFRSRYFASSYVSNSLDGFKEIGDEISNTGMLSEFGTSVEPETDHLFDRTTGAPGWNRDIADDPPLPPDDSRFKWKTAIMQSLIFLGVQHGFALATQEKTRHALADGNFFVDYHGSVKALGGWDDGGRFFTNYIAHPMQGAFTGFIYVQNDPKSVNEPFGATKLYWKSRTYAFLWSTFWSTQFELGPVSQASIGNIGLYGKQAWGDIVVTPTVGTAWMITEDALDRYLIRHAESQNNLYQRIFLRLIFNPVRSVANLFRLKVPWYRDRPLGS